MKQSTEDGFLGGRVRALQFRGGFRSGIDAVMLAAAVPAREGEELLELGCGAGVASLCLASRVKGCSVRGVEIVPHLVEAARESARLNGMERRLAFVQGDVLDLPRELRLSFSHVFCNPPFHDDRGDVSPHKERALALEDAGRLKDWIAAALKRVVSNGTMTLIIRADRLGEALRILPQTGVTLFPLWPRRGEAAKRVIVQVRKASRAQLALLSGMVLHHANGGYSKEAEEVLRSGGSLALASPRQ